MSKVNNKMQVDIMNLFKQNANDLSSIKELYRKLKEVEEKITQIKYIDNNLANKLKKEYESLKRIILDENIQAKLTDYINVINSHLDNIVNNTKHIINVTNENYEECVKKMRDGYIFNIIEDITINKTIVFSNLKNIEFRCNSVIRVTNDFTSDSKSIIKFDKCNEVIFECKELDLENKVLFDSDGMNFIVLFTDCEDVSVINTKILNGINIKGLSSAINGVCSKKVGKNFRVDNLVVKNCRSAVFTQYRGNTIENVKAYNTNDAIIALNGENCNSSYINNCYCEYNKAFPLIAVENNASIVNINNCIARNSRGLFELFGLANNNIDVMIPQKGTINISNSTHIIDDEGFVFDPSVTLSTLSLRRGVEKYVNININKVDCYNTTQIPSNYLYMADTSLNNSVLKNFTISNSNVFINKAKEYIILFNASVKNLTLINNKFESVDKNNGWFLRHTRDSIIIDNIVINDCIIDGFQKSLSADFEYNDFIKSFTMKNTRFYNTNAVCFNYPNGRIYHTDYNIAMFLNDYTLSNRGCSRVVYERSLQPPTVGKWYAGDIAINKFNHEEYYYNGSSWIKRSFKSQ